MPWTQEYSPIGHSEGLSAAVAAVPLGVIFVCLAILRMKVTKSALIALATAFALAVSCWGMPARLAGLATAQGALFGLFPVFYIVLTTLFLFNITVKSGQFDIIRASLAGVTNDRRIQAVLVAFCFGAFVEGAAGFGAPVAIAGATLVALGFRPFYAAGICLVANTAPVAFGSIGIPIVAMGGVMGLNDTDLMKLSATIGHQLPFVSLIVPTYIILLMVGFRRTMEVLPAVVTCGVVFAVCQWAVASFMGPYLPDILASIASMAALMALLRFWQPKTLYRFEHDPAVETEARRFTGAQVFRAWSPYLALTVVVLLWGVPSVKAQLNRATVMISVPGLDNAIVRMPLTAHPGALSATGRDVAPDLVPVPAKFKLDYLAASGTAAFFAALISAAICGLGAGETLALLGSTLRGLRSPALAIAAVLALAYVMNASGMTTCLGIFATKAGSMFPLISPLLGWLGVFLTGSDTSSNVLFGGLQKAAAEGLGINPLLTAAANTSGGVMGKMISPQSLAVACAATGLVGEEGSLFRFTFRHSLVLLSLVCVICYLQAYVLSWMVPA
jgi:lactate permease